jgi:hypothetical protein
MAEAPRPMPEALRTFVEGAADRHRQAAERLGRSPAFRGVLRRASAPALPRVPPEVLAAAEAQARSFIETARTGDQSTTLAKCR